MSTVEASALAEKEYMVPKIFRVLNRRQETHDTFTLTLMPKELRADRAFLPGQFNMLYVFGVGEVPISISGNPREPSELIHTTRAVGTVTKVLGSLKPGSEIGVRGPFGSHWPVENAEGGDVIIVAGGIGLAPLRPVIYELMANRDRYERIVLLYGARTPEDILFAAELKKWRGEFHIAVHVTVDRAAGSWRGGVGVVPALISKFQIDAAKTVAMICGPEIMMRYSIRAFEKGGVPADRIYVSMERNMKCAIGICGHCQYGSSFVCKDGPVYSYKHIQPFFDIEEV